MYYKITQYKIRSMVNKKYIAEAIGTFALAFVVLASVSVANTGALVLPVPVIAGLTLALFVYTIGPISGSHINPAVTIGLLSVKKISTQEALMYVLAQLLGAVVALAVASLFMITAPTNSIPFDIRVFIAEALGTAFFTFGIASVVYGNVKDIMSGLVIGWSLLLGILIASLAGAFGILNPAVAFAVNAVSLVYILAPIVGAVAGFNAYVYIADKN
jgi:aquaporin Z